MHGGLSDGGAYDSFGPPRITCYMWYGLVGNELFFNRLFLEGSDIQIIKFTDCSVLWETKICTFRFDFHKGCMGFLAHVYDTRTQEVRLEDVLVVQDFPYAFPNDLPKLPLKQELEFTINLAPKIYPISLPLFRMAEAELKELKT